MQNTTTSFSGVLEQYAGVPVIVVGASGFIGRWVAHFLTRAGAELYLPARDCTAAKKTFLEYGVEGKIFKADLLDTDRFLRSIEEIGPAITFNLAGYGVDRSEQSERLADQINTMLPERICETIAEIKECGAWLGPRLVHAGTAMEYGSVTGDLREDSATQPTTLYGRSKLAGTKAMVSACTNRSLAAVTARLFAIYGPGESTERLLPTLIGSASTKAGHIELTPGLHKRDFTYIEDAAEALLRLGVSHCLPGDVVNVATGTLTPVRSFIQTASRILGITEDRLSFGSIGTRPEEMDHDPVNIDRLFELTRWKPGTNINDGIRRTLSGRRTKETDRSSAHLRREVCELF